MTRIISGSAGGRRLKTPAGQATRPTSDRVREALFSGLESREVLRGATVLDLYAGSGALGLEAASRGAARVLLVESDRRAAAVARENAAALGLSSVSVRLGTAEHLLGRAPDHANDLVLADPPYDVGEDALAHVLALLASGGWLAPGALLVVERSSRSPEPVWPAEMVSEGPRRYGETTLWFASAVGGHLTGMTESQPPKVPETPRPTGGDVVALILQDHRHFESLLRVLRDATADRDAARGALADALVAHGEAEESEVYPQLRGKRAITKGEAEHGKEEHAEGNQALLALLECKATDTQKFDDAVEALATALNHHIGEEEQSILNPARTEVGEDVRQKLGAAWAAKRRQLLDEGCGSIENVRRIVERAEGEGLLPAEGEE